MSTVSIKVNPLQEIAVDSLVFDPDNPNKMTQQEMQGLKESMQRFGYLTPIIIDQNNKIADGEHRALIYKQMGFSTIPGYQVILNNDLDRRLLRQIMNKLKGRHDPLMDIAELELLIQNDADSLKTLLNIDNEYIHDLKEITQQESTIIKGLPSTTAFAGQAGIDRNDGSDRPGDSDMTEHHAERYLHGNVKQIMLYFSNEEYEQIMPHVQSAKLDLNITDNTSLFLELLRIYENNRDR